MRKKYTKEKLKLLRVGRGKLLGYLKTKQLAPLFTKRQLMRLDPQFRPNQRHFEVIDFMIDKHQLNVHGGLLSLSSVESGQQIPKLVATAPASSPANQPARVENAGAKTTTSIKPSALEEIMGQKTERAKRVIVIDRLRMLYKSDDLPVTASDVRRSGLGETSCRGFLLARVKDGWFEERQYNSFYWLRNPTQATKKSFKKLPSSGPKPLTAIEKLLALQEEKRLAETRQQEIDKEMGDLQVLLRDSILKQIPALLGQLDSNGLKTLSENITDTQLEMMGLTRGIGRNSNSK